jgi:CopG family nickel-responsive transcriptional regulator
MSSLYRFGVSLEKDLIERFDQSIAHRKYVNRSEALRDLIRESLVKKEWTEGEEVAGAITLIFDHHHRGLASQLMHTEHEFGDVIISSQHIHLDHNNCLEILAVKAEARRVQKLACALRAYKGVKHVTLNMTTTGKSIV